MAKIEGFDSKPLVIGKVFGLRTFRPTETGELKPISMEAVRSGFVWHEGENHAFCDTRQHTPAIKGCHCGFWAFTSENNTVHREYSYVQGVIEAWGRLVVGTKGFRAEFARILVLVEPDIGKLINPTVSIRFNKVKRNLKETPIVPNLQVALSEFPISHIHPSDFEWSSDYE